jgi:hypothetical protein
MDTTIPEFLLRFGIFGTYNVVPGDLVFQCQTMKTAEQNEVAVEINFDGLYIYHKIPYDAEAPILPLNDNE